MLFIHVYTGHSLAFYGCLRDVLVQVTGHMQDMQDMQDG